MMPTESVATPPSRAERAAEPHLPTTRRGLVAGLGTGILAIGCCVGPTVAALLGVMSVATASDLANDLYGEWGWAFKAAGIAAGIAILLQTRRRTRTCGVGGGRPLARFALVLTTTAVASYFALYAVTTWLGE